jgi:hypothetical protein
MITSVYYSCYASSCGDQEAEEYEQNIGELVGTVFTVPDEELMKFGIEQEIGKAQTTSTSSIITLSDCSSSSSGTIENDKPCYPAQRRRAQRKRQTAPNKQRQRSNSDLNLNKAQSINGCCDRLYNLGKKSIHARRKIHDLQKAEEERRNIQFERGMKTNQIYSRSVASSSQRTLQLYELSKPRQMEGKLRRQALVNKL